MGSKAHHIHVGLGGKRRLLKIHVPTPQDQRAALEARKTDYLKSQAGGLSPPQYHWDDRVLGLSVSPWTAGTQLRLPSLGHNIETVSFPT